MERQHNLLEVVGTLDPAGRRPGGLYRRQHDRDENANDGNHHKQFHKGKTTVAVSDCRFFTTRERESVTTTLAHYNPPRPANVFRSV